MKLLGSSPSSWQTCCWGWEQSSITALRHGNLGRWPVPEAQCGSAWDPRREVGNEQTDASFHARFLCADSGESGQDKAKAFSSDLNMNLAGHILLEPLLGLVIKGSILNIFITCYSLPNPTKSRVVVQFSVVSDSATPWTAARQASLSFTNSRSLRKLMSIELVMLSSHLILCRPLLLLPSVFPSIRVFSNELALCTRWPKYWSFNSISPSNEY